jgi:hypothetical protein
MFGLKEWSFPFQRLSYTKHRNKNIHHEPKFLLMAEESTR